MAKYINASKFTYLKGYNEDKEDEEKVERARTQYLNTQQPKSKPTTPIRDGKRLPDMQEKPKERKQITLESERRSIKPSFSPSNSVRERSKPKFTPTDRKSPFKAEPLIRRATDEDLKKLEDNGFAKKITPFTKGFDKAFEPLTDAIVKPSAERKAAREQEYDQLSKEAPKRFGAGNIAGEFNKYGIAYQALGPTAAKIPGLAAINNPIARTLATEGAKDLAVGTTLRTAEGIGKGESAKQIGTNIIKDLPRDMAFNALMLGGGKAASAIKSANSKNAVFKGIDDIIKNTDINPKVPEAVKTVSEQPRFSPSSIEDIRKAAMDANTPKATDLNNATDVLKSKPITDIPKAKPTLKTGLNEYMTGNKEFDSVLDKILSRDMAFFGNNPSKREISKALSMYESTKAGLIDDQVELLKKQMGNGVETTLIPTADGMKRSTVSGNAKWYRDFYAANKRKPNNQELRELAEDFLRNGYDDMNSAVPKDAFFRELDDTVKAYEYLKNTDISKPNIEGLKPAADDLMIQPTKDMTDIGKGSYELADDLDTLKYMYDDLAKKQQQGISIDLQLFGELQKKIDTLQKINLGEQAKPKENWFKKAYQYLIDDTAPLKEIDQTAKKFGAESNVQLMAMNEKGSAKIISAMIENGVTDLSGNTLSKPINEIFSQVKAGERKEFMDYLLNKHNIDRMKQGKPVFGKDVSAQDSIAKVMEYERAMPNFKQASAEWTDAYDKFMRNWLVDGGMLSADQYNAMKEMYPNYVPTYRDMSDKIKAPNNFFKPKGYVNQKTSIKAATGSDRAILDPIENQLRQMDKYIKATKRNEVGTEFLKLITEYPEMRAFAEVIEDAPKIRATDLDQVDGLIDEVIKPMTWKKNAPNVVTVMVEGEPVYIAIKDKRVLDALTATSEGKGTADKIVGSINRRFTQPFKNLTTSNNPLFAGVNFMRDTQTRFIQGDNMNPVKELGETLTAAKDMATKDPLYKKYRALGGGASLVADDERAFRRLTDELYKGRKNPIDYAKVPLEVINQFNESVEVLNRFPAFKKKYLDELAKGSTEKMAAEKAVFASNEITTNFARGGSIMKTLDKIFPYSNAATQGIDKAARTFKEKPVSTTLKVALATVIPSLAAQLMQENDPDYQQLNNRTKDAYIPIGTSNPDGEFGNNKYFKAPMAQTYSLAGSVAGRTARALKGDELAFKGMGDTVKNSLLPVNFGDGGIFGPLVDIKTNKDFAGRTIVPMSMQERSPSLRYDDRTSEIGKIGSKGLKAVGIENDYTSPKAIDHIIDSTTGVVGDFALPLTTNDGKSGWQKATGPVQRRFIADPVFSNQSTQDFYDSFNKIKTKNADNSFLSSSADKGLPTVGKSLESEALGISKSISDINSRINDIQKSSIPPKEKETTIRALNIEKAMMATEFNKNKDIESTDYSIPYKESKYQSDIDRLSGIGIDSVKPKSYNSSSYKIDGKDVSLSAEDKVRYTKMAREMYEEKGAKIFSSNLSDEAKAKKLAEINKEIDKKIKQMMKRGGK